MLADLKGKNVVSITNWNSISRGELGVRTIDNLQNKVCRTPNSGLNAYVAPYIDKGRALRLPRSLSAMVYIHPPRSCYKSQL